MPDAHIQLTNVLGETFPEGRQVVISGPEAKRLAFLARIDADLQLVIERCDNYAAELAAATPSVPLLSSIAESAFIAYGRIAQGAGGIVPRDVMSQLDDDHARLHRWAMAVRDKHVGHSVNAMNQTLTVAIIDDSEGVRLRGVFAENFRVVLNELDIHDLRRVAVAIRAALASELLREQESVLEVVGRDPAASFENPQPQLELVPRGGFDYDGTRAELRGAIGVPVNLEERSYGDLNDAEER